MAQDGESRADKVQTTVRMDPVLHRQLSDYVYELGRHLPPRERPSADAVIQDAIRRLLEGAAKPAPGPTLGTDDQLIPKPYLPLVLELVNLLQEPDKSRHCHWRDAVHDLLQARIDERKR